MAMESDLINHKYLQELIEVARDQEQDDLIGQLYSRLIESRKSFLHHSTQLLNSPREQLGPELHKLKNQFANLGCEAVTQLLEEMYQFAKRNEPDQVQKLLPSFEMLSEKSLQELQTEIQV